ncbi:MAG TPA: hypothetical protein VFW94_23890 [Candidatus Acidoferrales bacterium]|nr:hypothetical protein [Candidatus Acidoferrales bacterium]
MWTKGEQRGLAEKAIQIVKDHTSSMDYRWLEKIIEDEWDFPGEPAGVTWFARQEDGNDALAGAVNMCIREAFKRGMEYQKQMADSSGGRARD